MGVLVSRIADFFRRGPARVLGAVAVVAIVGGSLGFIVVQGGEGGRALLYSGLDLTESAEIAGKLDQANIAYKFEGNGSAIFVSRDRVLDARIMLSEEGLPTNGSVGYEIFDRSEALGATSFIQNVNRVRALEGELARTIASLEIVRSARVHLVLPERRLFERDQQKPSASVVLSIAGRDLGSSRVRAVRNLVAGAVPGLDPEKISVLDDRGRLLAAGAENSDGVSSGAGADERRIGMEERIRSVVLELVEGVTGPGAARVQVSADVDFNRVTNHQERYDPEGRVVRSTQTVEERNDEASREGLQGVTASENLPKDSVDSETDATSQMNSNRVEETVNYEISKSTRTEIVEAGRINKLSVAVAVDDLRMNREGGEAEFVPRSREELDRITRLVRSAIGYDEERGDVVEVINISFVRPNISMEGAEAPGAFDFDKHDVLRAVEILAFLVAALVLSLLVLRPLVVSLTASEEEGGEVISLPSAGEGVLALPLQEEERKENRIELDRVSGKVRETTIKRIQEMVDRHPEASLQVLRGWLNEDQHSSRKAASAA